MVLPYNKQHQCILLLDHINKRLRIYAFGIYLPEYIYGYKKTAFFVTYYRTYRSILHNPSFPNTSMVTNPCAFFVTDCQTYTSLLHKLRLPPIIHSIPSITIYTYIQNSVKTHHLPQFTSFLRKPHIHRTMWDQSEKPMTAWIHRTSTESIQDPGRPKFLTRHFPSTLEASTCLTKKSCSLKHFIQFHSLPSNLLHKIDM